MKAIEEIDVEKLVEVCKQVNEVVENEIEVVGVATVDLIKDFSLRLEAMSNEEQDKIPVAVEFYNDLYKDEVGEPTPPAEEGEEEKKDEKSDAVSKKPAAMKKKKAAATKKKKEPKEKKEPKAKKEKAPPREKDEYGFSIGTKNNLFLCAIKETPMKMKDVRELPWNEKKVTFYEMFKKLKEAGKVDVDEEGRMFVK